MFHTSILSNKWVNKGHDLITRDSTNKYDMTKKMNQIIQV